MRHFWLVAALLLLAVPARGELWMSSNGELLATAKRIELVEVTRVQSGQLKGKVVRAFRGGAKVGSDVVVLLPYNVDPLSGVSNQVLIICDSSQCPRAIGLDRGGYFALAADEPGDGAWVLPGVVEPGSIERLAAGKPAPALCVRAAVELVDEPGARRHFEIMIDAATGNGTVAAGQWGKAALTGHLRLDDGHIGRTGDAVLLSVTGKQGGQDFVGGPLRRAADGCYDASFLPSRPLARDSATLDANLGGAKRSVAVATGTLHVDKDRPLAAGDYKVELSVDASGQLVMISPLLGQSDGILSSISLGTSSVRLGFGHDAGPVLGFEIPLAPDPHGVTPLVLRALIAGPVIWQLVLGDKPLGIAHLTYAPTKVKAKKKTQ